MAHSQGRAVPADVVALRWLVPPVHCDVVSIVSSMQARVCCGREKDLLYRVAVGLICAFEIRDSDGILCRRGVRKALGLYVVASDEVQEGFKATTGEMLQHECQQRLYVVR